MQERFLRRFAWEMHPYKSDLSHQIICDWAACDDVTMARHAQGPYHAALTTCEES